MQAVQHVFDPLPGQREFMEATEPEILYSGSLGAGKTLVGLEKLLFLALRYPGNELLIVRKVMADLPGTTLLTWREKVLPPRLVVRQHMTEHYVIIQTPGGETSRVWWTGMDRILRLGGTEFGGIFFDECVEAEEEDWVMLEGRLRHGRVPFHQLMGATNPGAPTHFLHDRFFTRGKETDPETGERLRRVVLANSLDNPHLPATYRRRLNRFVGVYRERFILGKWVGYEGLVYPEFDPAKHIIPSFPVPGDWRRGRSTDFGGGNPHSVSWYAQDPESGTWFQYRQVYQTGLTAAALGDKVNKESKGEGIEFTVADHDKMARLEFEAQGIDTEPARKDVDLGLQKVREWLMPRNGEDGRPLVTQVATPGLPGGRIDFPGGAPRILFMEDALVMEDPVLIANETRVPLRTTHEFGFYKWAKAADGTPRDVPVKKHDHGLDELRYFIMHVDPHDGLVWTSVDRGQYGQERKEAEAKLVEQGQLRISTKEARVAARRARRRTA